jgi:hypothetical protein
MNKRARSRTPKPDQPPVDLIESLVDLLASMLVEEWKAQHSQIVTELMVSSPPQTNRRFLPDVSSMLVDSARKAYRSDAAGKASPVSIKETQ